MRNSRRIVTILVILVAVSFVLQAGRIFSPEKRYSFIAPNQKQSKDHSENDNEKDESISEKNLPYRYEFLDTVINGKKEKIHILEVDISDSKVTVKPALSYGVIYGFEKLSAIAEREEAAAAINGGFFHEYGEPGGMVMVDGELYTSPTGRYPIFIIKDRKAYFDMFNIGLWIEVNGQNIKLNNINVPGTPGLAVVYTPVYGTTNRADIAGKTVVVKNGKISEVIETDGPVNIPGNGFLVTFYYPLRDDMPVGFKRGMKASFFYEPFLGDTAIAYECGSFLVKDGENVAGEHDPWVGVLTNNDPRTAIGIKDENTVVMIVVDGRQPGFSEGLTAKELADFMLERGVKYAAMLDGGASSEMIVDGEIVNRPSYKGEERKIAGAIVVKASE